MWLLVLATTLLVVVDGQKRPTISFISGAGSGEVVTDLGKSAELICQVSHRVDDNEDDDDKVGNETDDDSDVAALARVSGGGLIAMSWAECP